MFAPWSFTVVQEKDVNKDNDLMKTLGLEEGKGTETYTYSTICTIHS